MAFDLDGFLPYRLSVAAAEVSRQFSTLYAAEAGLSIPEWRVLAHLGRSGAVSVRDINSRVNLDKSVVSRAAARLEQRGLIRKSVHKTDMRLVSLELTPEGEKLMQRLARIARDFQARIVAELGDDAAAFERVLGILGPVER